MLHLGRTPSITTADQERFPVDPNDFDHHRMLDTISKMQQRQEEQEGDDSYMGSSGAGEVGQREDENFVYYEIPTRVTDGLSHKLNVQVKNGMIHIVEDTKDDKGGSVQMSSERMFSIDPSLNGDRAEVINEKDKVIIKIPKR